VLVELSSGGGNTDLQAWLEAFLASVLERGLCSDAVLAQSDDQARRLWSLRENISEAQKIEGISIKHDVSLPISCIGDFLDQADAALAAAYPGLRVVAFGHIGDGNLHYNLSMPERDESGENTDNAALIAAQPEVNRIVHDLVHQHGGSISAEHGIGQLKREEILRYKSPVEMELMRAVKRAMDPQGLMNPGKVL
jgi:FAD/FMN-containing dehydrogenase